MVEMPTQSRGGVKGGAPLQGQGAAPLVGFGATPQPFLVKSIQRKKSTRRRQRSVPASNFALPQKRPQAALLTTCPLARPRCWSCRHGMSFLQAEDFASAEATRGLCGRPLDPFAMHAHAQCTPMFLDFDCCRGDSRLWARQGGSDGVTPSLNTVPSAAQSRPPSAQSRGGAAG